MNLNRPFRIEFEISSLCNAKCSGCQRTMLDDKGEYYYKGNISMVQMNEWFDDVNLKDARIKLCGVLGDPIINPECVDICSYLILEKKVDRIELSTNGGTRGEKFWKDLAEISHLSKRDNDLSGLVVHWSIDGVTKNDYRENVSLEKVWKNFNIYHKNKGRSIWQYIHFDYNADEIELAKKKAQILNIPLRVRVSWRNTGDVKFKSKEALKLDSQTYEEVKNRSLKRNYEESDIVCRHKIENEIFVTSEGKIWPCCHLHDEQVSYKTDIIKKINLKNDLNEHKLYDILKSDWYQKTLEDSWNKNHPLHLPRCYLTCGDNGKRIVVK